MDPKRNNETGKDGAQPKRPKGNILVAFVITLAIVLLIGGIYKLISSSQYKETTYSDFLASMAAGELADRALSCTLALPFQETDDLALGNAGIALALTEAACRRSDPGLLRAAGERLAQSAQRAKQDGGYRSVPLRLRNIPDPSFWRGIAGIGYAMLKYAEACEKVQNPLP